MTLIPTATGELTGDLLRAAHGIAPGQALQLTGKSGKQFALLDWQDFETIMERAGMRIAGTVTATKSNTNQS